MRCKIATCGVAVISNSTGCVSCVVHAAVFGDTKIIYDAGISFLAFVKPIRWINKVLCQL